MMFDDKKMLIELAYYKMPYGKYKDHYLVDIPEAYYTWLKNKGFSNGKLGRMQASMYEVKINGLEYLIREIQHKYPLK